MGSVNKEDKPVLPLGRAEDLTGVVFGKLTALYRTTPNGSTRLPAWLCQCTCGNYSVVYAANLRNGCTKSCGCSWHDVVTIHGLANKCPEYYIWKCISPRVKKGARREKHYYLKGIKLCDRWHPSNRLGFYNFIHDMGRMPLGKNSIDRLDNSKGYEPGNCRWADEFDQANNRTITKYVTYKGEKRPCAEVAREMGIDYLTLYQRCMDHGDNVDEHKIGNSVLMYEFQGRKQGLIDWATELGIKWGTLYHRLVKSGWSVEKAFTTPVRSNLSFD